MQIFQGCYRVCGMKIIKKGRLPKDVKYRGSCQDCCCEVECDGLEVAIMVDRDSPNGARYVKCPECGREHLWVR